MTQQIIDIGANANDGTGEPLRQAFQAVNDNFSNIWAAGPVDSQVVIRNNVITTNETNLDLILAGNGIGTVTVQSTVLPNIDSVYNLGNVDRQFDSTYSRFFYGNGRFLSGINTGGSGGNVYFSATPPLNPQIGDIWIESDTATQYLYFSDNTSNQWAELQAYQSFSSATGTGNVDLTMINSDVVPQMSNVWTLGNVTNQWLTVYTQSLNTHNVSSASNSVTVTANTASWTFGTNGSLILPAANVQSTPSDPGFANATKLSIIGSIYTVAGNPLPSYSNTLGQTVTVWTATNANVTAAKMTLRVQYATGPVAGIEICDLTLAKEWGSNANVTYAVTNRLRTNTAIANANVQVALDGSDNLIVDLVNDSGLNEYYSYSVTEFDRTTV